MATGCSIQQHDIQHESDSIMTSSLSSSSYDEKDRGSGYLFYSQAQLKQSEGLTEEAVRLMEKASATDPDSVYLKKELASLYLRNSETDKAIQTASDLAKKHPKDVDALLLYAGVLQVMKLKPDEVVSTYEKILSLDPKQKNVYLMLGRLYLEKDDQKKAFRVYNDLVRHFPDSYAGYFYLGRIHIQGKELVQAEKCFKKALEIDPAIEAPKFELIGIYKLQKKSTRAIEMYRSIISENPDNIHAHMGLGLYYGALGMSYKSEQVFYLLSRRMSDVSPLVSEVLVNYIEKNNIRDAVIILKGLLKGQPENSDLNYAMAVTYDREQKRDEMFSYLKKVKPDSRFYSIAIMHIAAILHGEKKNGEAISVVQKALEAQPENTELYHFIAYLYEEANNFGKAEEVLKKAISADESNSKLHYRLGVVYDKAGKREDSINSMKKVIEIEPDNANALNYLGYTYADMGINLDEAERLINEALKYKPDDGYILDSMGWLLYQKGDYEKALEYIDKALKKVTNDPTIMEHAGDIYEKLKNTDKANDSYKKSIELYKDEPSIKRINDKLRLKNEK